MRRFAALLALLSLMAVPVAFAGSPHFVRAPSVTQEGDALTVTGKIAGLGNETQVNVVLSADAECVNPGGNKPSADNKDSFSVDGDFPVQNGKALFSLTLVASFQPDCSPPMTVVYSNISVTVPSHGLSFP